MGKIAQFLFATIPKIKTRLQLSAFVVAAALLVIINQRHNDALLAEICIGGIAVIIILFAQLFSSIKDFPVEKRTQIVIVLFCASCVFVLALAGIAVFGLKDTAPKPVDVPIVKADSTKHNDDPNKKAGLSLDVKVRKQEATTDAGSPIRNGDTISAGKQAYKIDIPVTGNLFVYVVQIDSKGKLNWLFPKNDADTNSEGDNAFMQDRSLQVPQEQWYLLDDNTGKESVFAIGTNSRWFELEVKLADSLRAQQQKTALDHLIHDDRGARGKTHDPITTRARQASLTYWTDFFKSKDSVVVAETWFYHGR